MSRKNCLLYLAGLVLSLAGLGVWEAPAALKASAEPAPLVAQYQPGVPPIVYVLPITGMIDLGLAPFVRRVVDEATAAGAAAVILQIDTFGGRVDAAVQIRDTLLRAKTLTVAFVDKRAISAGALIALAAEKITMADGGTIGAAAPVIMGQPGAPAQPAREKTVSYVRKEFRATAESRGRPLRLAEAMVDADVEVPGVIAKGKLLTLTTAEALKHKVADFQAEDLQAVLARLDLVGASVRQSRQNWAEMLVRFLTDPVVSSLLMSVGILGILIEIRTPGFGLPGALGLASLALVFWGHAIVHLAGWEELLLIGLGLGLLLVELFVLPGFGIAGILGIGSLLGGLTLMLVGGGATSQTIVAALFRVLVSLLLALGGLLALGRVLPRLPFGRRLILKTEMRGGEGFAAPPDTDPAWLGKRGMATTTLRPAGMARLEGQRVDVVTDGEYIEAGAPVEVIRVDGNRIVVRRADRAAGKEES